MKPFLIFSLTVIFGFLGQGHAQSIQSPSSQKYLQSFSVGRMPFGMAKNIDWSHNSEETERALAYRADFERAVSNFKKTGVGQLAAGKLLVIEIGCGTQCVAIGLYNLETGVPSLLKQAAAIGASYLPTSRLIVLDAPEAIEEVYSNQTPGWLKTQFLVISESGEAIEFVP